MVYVGILASIAIPAYQDFTIRAQVNAGLSATYVPRSTVSQSYTDTGDFDQSAYLEFNDIETKYVESITVDQGNIVVVYGGEANPVIQGQQLVYTPFLDTETREFVWICGFAEPNPNMQPLAPSENTTIELKYLPSSCK